MSRPDRSNSEQKSDAVPTKTADLYSNVASIRFDRVIDLSDLGVDSSGTEPVDEIIQSAVDFREGT